MPASDFDWLNRSRVPLGHQHELWAGTLGEHRRGQSRSAHVAAVAQLGIAQH